MTLFSCHMPWGFQIVARLPKGRLSGEANPWDLPPPVGTVEIAATPSLSEASEIQFRVSGFASQLLAQQAGETLRWWLRIAGVKRHVGFDFGQDLVMSGLGEHYRAILDEQLATDDAFLVPDVHGLTTFEEAASKPRRFAMRAEGRVSLGIDSVLQAVIEFAASPGPSDRRSLACDLISLADRESSGRARLVALTTAMEVLCERDDRRGRARDILEKFIADLHAAKDALGVEERRDLQSLESSLFDLRQVSIGRSIRDRAAEVVPSDSLAAKKAGDAYTCRSQLVHSGTSERDPDKMTAEVRPIVEAMVLASP